VSDHSKLLKRDAREQFGAILAGESPRGVILIAAQFADTMLESVLRAACRSDQVGEKLIAGFNAPLGTFSSRILAAHAFGLLPDDDYFNLEQLRQLRNHCAHSMTAIEFTDESVKARIGNLRIDSAREDPKYKIGFVLGSLNAWCVMSVATMEERKAKGLPALESGEFTEAARAKAKPEPPEPSGTDR
jgi:DNA-binding MltR family transcriptional regulator